ncbi:cysteine hydrolase family protein [Paralcaligenes ureilyticus]|uniref:Isochorismatase family protein n=1 Tax=Paralcaligenes ureilyticus TaxID=627131 RepID=A0A4R3M8Y0_9BURK|nr:cysteine hydrolase [Paralcaligenes ureilyticus]TCT09616.1 isochorismatase family protein [Paralcaligenes ureilyticus]
MSAKNKSFYTIKETDCFSFDDVNVKIHSSLAPKPNDTVVTKHRVGAFAGTDLDMILCSNSIDTLLLAGIATGGVVLSTLRYAADADYQLLVIGDCCSDSDPEVHSVLIDKVFPRQATIVSSDTIIGALA